MEQQQPAEQPEEKSDRYEQFAQGRRKLYAEIGSRTLDEAQHDKRSKEMDIESNQRFIEHYTQKIEKLRDDVDAKKRIFKVTPVYDPGNIVDMPGIYKQHLDAQHKRASVTKVFDKAALLLSEEERELHGREKDNGDGSNVINVY